MTTYGPRGEASLFKPLLPTPRSAQPECPPHGAAAALRRLRPGHWLGSLKTSELDERRSRLGRDTTRWANQTGPDHGHFFDDDEGGTGQHFLLMPALNEVVRRALDISRPWCSKQTLHGLRLDLIKERGSGVTCSLSDGEDKTSRTNVLTRKVPCICRTSAAPREPLRNLPSLARLLYLY